MKRVASPRGWPKKVFSEPGVSGRTESFVRLDAMVVPCCAGGGLPHTKETFGVKWSPKVPVVLQALFHHTAGHCRIWKDLRLVSQVKVEPYTPFPRSLRGSHRTDTGSLRRVQR